jgi:ComF family protein
MTRSVPTHKIGSALTRAVAPLLRCHVCQEAVASEVGVCEPCRLEVEAAVRRLPPPNGSSFWLGPYAGPWLRLVHALKFQGERRMAVYLGDLLATRCLSGSWRPHIVCHVPASPERLVKRGYDQAALLAQGTAAKLHVEHVALLGRAAAAERQARLGRAARAQNADRAFAARYAPGRRVLLVDDVMTTGATAAACSAALSSAGAAEVRTAVVARTSSRR